MSKKTIMAVLFSSFIVLSIFAAAQIGDVRGQAKTIVVPTDYPTIQEAINNARNGDTIFIRSGTYEGPIDQTIIIDKTLTIIGENVDNTILELYPAYSVSTILFYAYYDYSDAIEIVAENFRLLNLSVTIPALTSTPSFPGYIVVSQKGGDISATGDKTEIAGNKITTEISVKGSYCKITENVAAGLRIDGSLNEASRNSFSSYGFQTQGGSIWIYGESNVVKDNNCGALYLSYTNSSLISGNKVLSASDVYSGIDVGRSDNNVFCRNEIYGFEFGFRFWFSSGNTIVANIIDDPDETKISVASMSFGNSSNNRIYLNNFVDEHAEYVYDFYTDSNYRSSNPGMTPSSNSWDNGTIGNYWSSFNATDANSNGVYDTPYTIDSHNQDNLPLTTQVNIDSVIFELPSPKPTQSPSPTPTLPPNQTSSPTPPPPTTPSPSPELSLSPLPTAQPTNSAPTSTPEHTPASTLTATPTTTPTIEPTPEPTQTATPTSDNNQTLDFMPIILAAVVVAAVAVGALVYFRRRKN